MLFGCDFLNLANIFVYIVSLLTFHKLYHDSSSYYRVCKKCLMKFEFSFLILEEEARVLSGSFQDILDNERWSGESNLCWVKNLSFLFSFLEKNKMIETVGVVILKVIFESRFSSTSSQKTSLVVQRNFSIQSHRQRREPAQSVEKVIYL